MLGCNKQKEEVAVGQDKIHHIYNGKEMRGGLLLQGFKSFNELKEAIDIQYQGKNRVVVSHYSEGKSVTKVLTKGVTENDLYLARDGSLWDKMRLLFKSPYSVIKRNDLKRIFLLGRKKDQFFGEGDVAFYNVAESMVNNISLYDQYDLTPEDIDEKGYLNTFNHLTAQAMITSIFSEKLADFIADLHERYAMPELITGNFTEEQILDLKFGPADNYLDIINNEWGQELGKELKIKYQIDKNTSWTPELLADYLNDVQSYSAWAFQIGFDPFIPADEIIIKFSRKINLVMDAVSRY
jgi:hypothetical protein